MAFRFLLLSRACHRQGQAGTSNQLLGLNVHLLSIPKRDKTGFGIKWNRRESGEQKQYLLFEVSWEGMVGTNKFEKGQHDWHTPSPLAAIGSTTLIQHSFRKA
jgi:hypothetical protein